MWKEKGRAAIYEMAGVYLLFNAVNIYKNRAESTGGEYILICIFIAFFIIVGLGMIGLGLYILRRKPKDAAQETVTENTCEEIFNDNSEKEANEEIEELPKETKE